MNNQKILCNCGSKKDSSDLVMPLHYIIILTIPKNCSYYDHSMMAIGQVCPYRLAVQDISLSRRQRGFDFPWG